MPTNCASAPAPSCCARRPSPSGLLDGADAPPDDGVLSEAASEAIEALLEKCVVVPEPSEEACRRHHAAHRRSTHRRAGRARHILFAVTQGVDVSALRQRAEATCWTCAAMTARPPKTHLPKRRPACPTARAGRRRRPGLADVRRDCAPEFARELFGHAEVGVLPRWCTAALACTWSKSWSAIQGVEQPFEAVRGAVPWHCARKPTSPRCASTGRYRGRRDAPGPVSALAHGWRAFQLNSGCCDRQDVGKVE
jgi:peptidyl-prolyl cis-trans isomerase C